jgi:hypothetical protein
MREQTWIRRSLVAIAAGFILMISNPAAAKEGYSHDIAVCDSATRTAAQEFGVPTKVMQAIARTESGVTMRGSFVPWPWTINVEGRGVRFNSKKDAFEFFTKARMEGSRNIDVGCFQVNHRWHGRKFASAQDMLEPIANARYAARFLKGLYQEFGDWTKAAGAYHSRNREFSDKYLARYIPILNALRATSEDERNVGSVRKTNTFPLLTGNSQGGVRGSLFPSSTRSRGSLIGPSASRG